MKLEHKSNNYNGHGEKPNLEIHLKEFSREHLTYGSTNNIQCVFECRGVIIYRNSSISNQ